ncbi:hypothetical protein YH63_011005 [Afipia massiliensis]|uniref:PepSY domain-containing protein n=1 Tax=Afipia massiliensis TaxID=211460 RepID=A0A4V6Y1E1_9BRAD|nr:hypothetical protein [Afipia massiliensis]TKT71903.1 hypothetical protein YH63_011005 [Afipia massiliensis]
MTLFSRGPSTGRAVAAGAFFAAIAAFSSPMLAADDFPVVGDIRIEMPRILEDDGPTPPPEGRYVGRYDEQPYPQRPYAGSYRPGPYGSGSHAAIPSARNLRSAPAARPMLPPEQVVTVLRSSGYSPLGRVTQRGWIYTVAAFDRYGDDGRLIIDARTGQIIRFIPAQAVDERIMGVYGPPPTVYAGYENRRGSLLDLRNAPRPPNAVPKSARRSPKAATQTAQPSPGGTAPAPQAAAPAPAAAPSAEPAAKPAVAEAKPAAATVGAAGPSAAAPSTLKLWPTQAMPDVQPLQ